MSLLVPDTGLLFWMVLSFGIVFFILAKYGFPVILKSVEQRKEYITNSVEAAKEANSRLAEIKQEGEVLLAEVRKQQKEILNEALADKERILTEAHQKAIEETQRILDQTTKQIQQEKQKAIREVRTEVAMLSVSVAEKVIRNKLDMEGGQKEMINRLIDEITVAKS